MRHKFIENQCFPSFIAHIICYDLFASILLDINVCFVYYCSSYLIQIASNVADYKYSLRRLSVESDEYPRVLAEVCDLFIECYFLKFSVIIYELYTKKAKK